MKIKLRLRNTGSQAWGIRRCSLFCSSSFRRCFALPDDCNVVDFEVSTTRLPFARLAVHRGLLGSCFWEVYPRGVALNVVRATKSPCLANQLYSLSLLTQTGLLRRLHRKSVKHVYIRVTPVDTRTSK